MTTENSLFRNLQPLPGVTLAIVTALLAGLVRHQFVEPDRLGLACQTTMPWWCGARTMFIVFSQVNGFGLISVALAVLAGLRLFRNRNPVPFAMAAMGFGGAGMLLYNVTFSSIAVFAATLVLAQREVQARSLR